jgi:hypothetical protein
MKQKITLLRCFSKRLKVYNAMQEINKLSLTIVFLLLSVLISCSSPKQDICKKNHVLNMVEPVDDRIIDVTDEQYSYSISDVYQNKDGIFYVGLDEKNNALNFYDLNKQEIFKTLEISLDGKSALEVTDFYVRNFDSIFIYSDLKFDLQLRNIDGALIDQYNLRGDGQFIDWYANKQFQEVEGWEARIKFDSVTLKMLIPVVPNTKAPGLAVNTLIEYSIANRKFENIGSVIPPDIVPNNLHPAKNIEWYNIISYNSDTIISSYFGSEFISVGTLKSKEVASYCRNSTNVTIEDEGKNLSIERQRELIGTSGMYINGFYSPEKNKFVVIVRHHQKYKNPKGLVNNVYDAGISLIILNSSLEVEKELVLEKGLYDYKHIHAFGDQILVLKENVSDINNSEDSLYFSVFNY